MVATTTLTVSSDARAGLPVKPVTYAWDKTDMLRAKLPTKEALDDAAIQKLFDTGLPVVFLVRGYVVPLGGGPPIGLTAHSCNITWAMWDDVWLVSVNGGKRQPVATKKGIYTRCTELDLPIVARATLKLAPSSYFLRVKVEVNPVTEEMQKQIQAWVTRPTGTAGAITAGDTLFSAFAGTFMQKDASAAKVLEFETNVFPN
jgi:hypothetical protein